jgi:hypothetical protein
VARKLIPAFAARPGDLGGGGGEGVRGAGVGLKRGRLGGKETQCSIYRVA